MTTVSPLEQDDFVSPHIFRTSQLVHRELAKYPEIQALAEQLARAPPEAVKELLGEQVKLIKESLENSPNDYADVAAEIEKLAIGDVHDLATEAAGAVDTAEQAGGSAPMSETLAAFFSGHGAFPSDPSQQMRKEINEQPQSNANIGAAGASGLDTETWPNPIRDQYLARVADDQQGRGVLRVENIPDKYLLSLALEPEGAVFLKRKWADVHQPEETRHRLTDLVLTHTLELAMAGTSGVLVGFLAEQGNGTQIIKLAQNLLGHVDKAGNQEMAGKALQKIMGFPALPEQLRQQLLRELVPNFEQQQTMMHKARLTQFLLINLPDEPLEVLFPPFCEHAFELADDPYGNYTLQAAIRRFGHELVPSVLKHLDKMLLSEHSTYVLRQIVREGNSQAYRHKMLEAIAAGLLTVAQRPGTADLLRVWKGHSDEDERLEIAELFLSTHNDGQPVLAELVKSQGGLQAISAALDLVRHSRSPITNQLFARVRAAIGFLRPGAPGLKCVLGSLNARR